MLRAKQAKHANGHVSARDRLTDEFVGRTDLSGKLGSLAAPLANKLVGEPGSAGRKVLERSRGSRASAFSTRTPSSASPPG
ncbi:MAG: hypothetical protein R2710_22625 [Acidimicrobiales bacterium]